MTESAITGRFSLKGAITYWWKVIRSAHSETIKYLFGDLRRGILELLLFLGAVFALAEWGRWEEAAEQVRWLLASGSVAVFVYGALFLFFFFYVPARMSRETDTFVNELQQQTGYSLLPTFQVRIEKISSHDADRSVFDTEMLFRIAIKNTHVRAAIETYVILEEMPEQLGISPAAHLRAIGKNHESDAFNIAPLETAYVSFLERRSVRDDASILVFAADTAHSGTTRVMKRLLRDWSRTGELLPENSYDGSICVYGKDALTCKIRFTVSVSSEGEPSVTLR